MFGPDPEPEGNTCHSALRLTARARLLAVRVPPFAITRWCDAWEAEAARQRLEPSKEYWNDGIAWILARVADGDDPPSAGEA